MTGGRGVPALEPAHELKLACTSELWQLDVAQCDPSPVPEVLPALLVLATPFVPEFAHKPKMMDMSITV